MVALKVSNLSFGISDMSDITSRKRLRASVIVSVVCSIFLGIHLAPEIHFGPEYSLNHSSDHSSNHSTVWMIPPAGAQDETLRSGAQAPDVRAQEQWLRYTNREHGHHAQSKNTPAILTNPNLRPGAQAVEPGSFFQAGLGSAGSPVHQMPGQIFIGGEAGAFYLPGPGQGAGGTPEPLGIRGQDGVPGFAPNFMGRVPYGFESVGGGSGGLSGTPYTFDTLGGASGSILRGNIFRRGHIGPVGALGPSVIQTRPSPSSGNYYQPATSEPGSSGSYYSSGSPWQVPVAVPNNNPQDYWGPDGNPFSPMK